MDPRWKEMGHLISQLFGHLGTLAFMVCALYYMVQGDWPLGRELLTLGIVCGVAADVSELKYRLPKKK